MAKEKKNSVLVTIGLILISGCAVQTEEQIDYKQLESLRPKRYEYMSEREKAERLKQIIANRERIFAEANKKDGKQVIANRKRIFAEANDGLYHVVFKGLNYYSKFPEAKRKQIYIYAVRLDDESGGMMDWDEGNKRVAEKYGISVTEARNISLEGTMKLWPQPEPPEPDFWKVK